MKRQIALTNIDQLSISTVQVNKESDSWYETYVLRPNGHTDPVNRAGDKVTALKLHQWTVEHEIQHIVTAERQQKLD